MKFRRANRGGAYVSARNVELRSLRSIISVGSVERT
jgi:hypothetical protein